jgi:hypothetical protein
MATMLTICMVATASQVMNTTNITLFLAVVLETILQNDPGIL